MQARPLWEEFMQGVASNYESETVGVVRLVLMVVGGEAGKTSFKVKNIKSLHSNEASTNYDLLFKQSSYTKLGVRLFICFK